MYVTRINQTLCRLISKYHHASVNPEGSMASLTHQYSFEGKTHACTTLRHACFIFHTGFVF